MSFNVFDGDLLNLNTNGRINSETNSDPSKAKLF